MAKSGSNRTITNLLRVSGLLFAFIGLFHVLRYFFQLELRVAGFEVTYLGSLIVGIFLIWLSIACFTNSRK